MLHAIVAYVLAWIEDITPFGLLVAPERERETQTHTCAAHLSDITTPVARGEYQIII